MDGYAKGDRVRVYRNLHNGLLSVQTWHKGKGWRVAAHVPVIRLVDVEFRVSLAGWERCRREGRKNVHAFVVGTVAEGPYHPEMLNRPIRYNPKTGPHFWVGDTCERAEFARMVKVMSPGKCGVPGGILAAL